MSDYWIGDWVRIKSTGKIGKFEGEENKKAKVKFDDKILLFKLVDIQLLPENDIPIGVNKIKRKEVHTVISKKYFHVIDLHITKLAPEMQNQRPELIVIYQVKKAKEFIIESINRNQLSVTIIHGKGTGVLKMEIESLLKSFHEVYFVKSTNDGGALEVLFQYR